VASTACATKHGAERSHRGAPQRGTVWLSRAGADALGVRIGDRITLGRSELQIAALVVQEPDAVLDYFNTAPKVFVSLADLDATGLVQPGARITYRLVVAGDANVVSAFVATLKPQLGRGQRIETAADARPEVRNALDRADRFLGLAALVSVVLASVAVAMAARRHTARHLDDAAVLRCLGASQREIASLHLLALLLLAVLASTLGITLAYALQSFAGDSLERTLGINVPAAGPLPALYGAAVGFTVLISFALPPVLALRRVPALRVLRRDIPLTETSAIVTTVVGLCGLVALLWWKSGSAELATSLLGGLALAFVALALLASLLVSALRLLRKRLRGAWRYGLANLSRRAASSLAQIAALGLGLTVLLLLGLVRSDLLARWREAIPANAPNQFVINIQQDQLEGVRTLLAEQGLPGTQTLFPMVRGRLLAVNGSAVSGDDYEARGERARRLAEREFNLSASTSFGDDNVATAGRLWSAEDADQAQWSVEEGFAKSLGWQVGDHVAFDVGGQRIEAPITSLRAVDWESFRPNFFVIGTPATIAKLPASYITSLHVPEDETRRRECPGRTFPEPQRDRHRGGAGAGEGHHRPGHRSGRTGVPVHARGRRAGAGRGHPRHPGRTPARRRGDARARRTPCAVAIRAAVRVPGDRRDRRVRRGDRRQRHRRQHRHPRVRSALDAEPAPQPRSRRDRHRAGRARRLVHHPPHRRRTAIGDVKGVGVIGAMCRDR
jgi:putative ABC transport system permease protein